MSARADGYWSGPSYDPTGTLTSTDGSNFTYQWHWRPNPYGASTSVSGYWPYTGKGCPDGFSGTISSTFTWVPDPNNPNQQLTPLYIKETASISAATSHSSTADDGLGDAAEISTVTNDYGSFNSASSHGSHLAQQGTNSPVTITRSLSAQSVRAQINMSYQAQTDSRAVTIGSSLGQTNDKSTTKFDSNGVALPEPVVDGDDGTYIAVTVKPCKDDSQTLPDGDTFSRITYSASPVGSWTPKSSYHWNVSDEDDTVGPDGTFTLPDDPPFSITAAYSPADASQPVHVSIDVTDAGSDGAKATGKAVINFHDPTENWQLWNTGSSFWQGANLDHCVGDDASRGTLAYAFHGTNVAGVFKYADDTGGAGEALTDMFDVSTHLVKEPWGALIAALGIAYEQTQPKDAPSGVEVNTAWDEPESTGLPNPRVLLGSTDVGTLDDYKMRPLLLVHYRPQSYRGDAYGTSGYTGGATEAFNQSFGVRGAGEFEPLGTTVPPGG